MQEELKHKEAIESLFAMFYESWMDDDDKREFVQMLLSKTGMTLDDLDNSIEEGIKNGYTIQEQLEAAKKVFNV